MDKIYQSHKQVTATPMTRIEYNEYRGWELPEDEKDRESDEGYLVEYLDGGESNHPDHKGYISWSPKEQFDNGYTVVPEDYVGRLRVEFAELNEKISKLQVFIGTEAFQDVSLEEQALLKHQLSGMTLYSAMLNARLSKI